MPAGNLTVHFIDVGTGDSELIQTPSGRTILIDAGDPDNGEFVADYLKNIGINTLDVVVASSPGNNKIGGMPWILSNFTVGDFLESGDTHNPTPYYIPLLALIQQKNIPYRTVKTGDIISLDPAVKITVLNPQETMSNDSGKNSVVLKMTYGNISFLFMGDVWGEAETTIATSARHADILKVGYHGNSISTGLAFLSIVKPEVSVIGTNTDTFGHRSPATIQRLKDSGSVVYITDVNGTVKVMSDGNTYSVVTER
jgi:beta-lactamase superfamily II metal-dependent hydrolase